MADHPYLPDAVLNELEYVLVDDLDLRIRIRDAVHRAGIWDAKSLWLARTSGAFLGFPGIGKASVREIDRLFTDHLESVLQCADRRRWRQEWAWKEQRILQWGWRPALNWPDR